MKYGFLVVMFYVITPLRASSFALGVENIPHNFFRDIEMHLGHPVRAGLITNQTGRTQQGVRTLEVLRQQGVQIKRLFVPEHGYEGTHQAGKTVDDSLDKVTGLEVVSLYEPGKTFFGKIGNKKKVSRHTIHDLDVLVFDIQDSGMRHYTYISTLLDVMRGVAHEKKHLIVLDRPNPLGPHMEGPLVEEKYISFVAAASIPVRHGMTIGELARYFNRFVLKDRARLSVVPMRYYDRSKGFNGAFLALLSPGIREEGAVYGYSFLGLLGEVRPFNFKRGPNKKYQCIGILNTAVEDHAEALPAVGALLDKYKISHTAYKDEKYEGFELQLHDAQFNSFSLLVDLLKTFRKYGVEIKFAKDFDWSVGTHKVQQYIMGTMDRAEFIEYINSNLKAFYDRAEPLFLYQPYPAPKYLR